MKLIVGKLDVQKIFYKKHRKQFKIKTRSPGTTSVCFSVVTVNDEHRKPGFKIKRRGKI